MIGGSIISRRVLSLIDVIAETSRGIGWVSTVEFGRCVSG